jgi:hypothetical protein
MIANYLSINLLQDYVYFISFFILLLEFLYIIFSFLITRQVKLLNGSFNTPYEATFRFIANTHFLVSIGVFVLSVLLF